MQESYYEIGIVLLVKRFIEHQIAKVKLNAIYQDNISSIKSKKLLSKFGKRTGHFDIEIFCVIDLISTNKLIIKYYPIDDMIVD